VGIAQECRRRRSAFRDLGSLDRELHFVQAYRCYVVRWLSDPSVESSREHWRSLLEHPEFEPGFAALHDLRGRGTDRGYESLVEARGIYASQVAPHVGDGRVSLLVDSVLGFGLARQMTILLDLEESARVTYSEEEAKTWIGLPADFPLPYPASSSSRPDSSSR
jgi:hypothetical protein